MKIVNKKKYQNIQNLTKTSLSIMLTLSKKKSVTISKITLHWMKSIKPPCFLKPCMSLIPWPWCMYNCTHCHVSYLIPAQICPASYLSAAAAVIFHKLHLTFVTVLILLMLISCMPLWFAILSNRAKRNQEKRSMKCESGYIFCLRLLLNSQHFDFVQS